MIPWRFRDKWLWTKTKLHSMNWIITQIFREGNTAADKMTSYATDNSFIWWDSSLNWFVPDLCKDMNTNTEHFRFDDH